MDTFCSLRKPNDDLQKFYSIKKLSNDVSFVLGVVWKRLGQVASKFTGYLCWLAVPVLAGRAGPYTVPDRGFHPATRVAHAYTNGNPNDLLPR